jgi:hypothetical protein
MNWKIWLVLATIICSSGYYLYTNNVKSKVQTELLKEQIITNAKTEKIKQELDVSKVEIVSKVVKHNNDVVEKVKLAKRHIIDATSDKPLSPLLKQTLIDAQTILGNE